MTAWRVHEVWTKDVVPSWACCQDAECPKEHRLYQPFYGVGPVVDKWEGIKHK